MKEKQIFQNLLWVKVGEDRWDRCRQKIRKMNGATDCVGTTGIALEPEATEEEG